jgi:hypothetical protein
LRALAVKNNYLTETISMANIQLQDELYAQLEQVVKASNEFTSVDQYAAYILDQVVKKKQQAQANEVEKNTNYSQADEDKIRERLKNLGYLD